MIDVNTLVENGITGFNVTMSYADLQAMAATIVSEIMRQVVPAAADSAEEKLLTKREVMDKLGICHTTLWNWERKRLLVPVKVGRKVHYRLCDIQKLVGRRQPRF